LIRERIASSGAVVAAFVSCLCCLGPLVAIGLGVGAFGAVVAPMRPYLLAASVVALGFGFRQAYRRAKVTCASDGTCSSERANRTSRTVLCIAALTVLLLSLAPYAAGPLGAVFFESKTTNERDATSENAAISLRRATLEVKGMTCATCETTVRLALERTPGVGSASVSFEHGEAVVDYDPARVTPTEITFELIRETGYESAPKEER
jgi:copper chaperone CopZ